jgi:hypothetical protein
VDGSRADRPASPLDPTTPLGTSVALANVLRHKSGPSREEGPEAVDAREVPMSLSRWVIAVVVLALLPLSTAHAQAPARTVAAQGAASVKVKAPSDKKHEAPIRAAVEAAEAKALPRAIDAARAHAADLARLSGLTLGAIVSVSDAPASPYGPFFGFYGTFGPDRFCGTIRTSVVKRDKSGKRRRVGSRARHICRVPPTVTSNVTVTFAVQ